MSKDEKPIHYESHPVSEERKAELLAQGVRIVDAAYAPAGWQQNDHVDSLEAGTGKASVSELREALAAAGVDFDVKSKKSDLQMLHAAFERSGLTGAEWNNLADEDKAARIES